MASVNRRRFLGAAGAIGAGSAATAIGSPAIAQSSPEITWRMPVSWPKSLDTLYGGSEQFAKYVSEATDGKFQIQPMLGDERIPALEVTEAVSTGAVEACHTAPYYMWSKDPTFAFGCAVPFGLNGRMQNAWWLEGGGEPLMNSFYARYNLYGLLAGNTMAQMGGWFRKEINTIDDLKGVKMRIGGFAAAVISKLGVVHPAAGRHRYLPGAGEGHDRRCRMGRPPRRREARPAQGGQVLLLPRLVGRRGHDPRAGQQGQVGGVAQGLSGDPQGGRRASAQLHGRALRCAEPGRPEEDSRHRHPAAALLRGRSSTPASRRPTRSTPTSAPRTRTSRSTGSRSRRSAPTSICGCSWPTTPTTTT